MAQEAICREPAEAASAGSGGSSAAERLRDRDPRVRAMAQADVLYDQGRNAEAAEIYTRLAASPADRRQTARRANLRLAQVALAANDFALAERHVERATARGANADVLARGRQLRTRIAYRREMAAADAELDRVDALLTAGNGAAAIQSAQVLLQRQCPYPADYPARVKTRIARAQRAQGDFVAARATALDAQSSAATPGIRQGTAQLITEIDAAALAAQLRGGIGQANTAIAAGDNARAIAILEPMLARPDLPAEISTDVRLRLARAYAGAGRFDNATATLDPMLAGGASSLSAEDRDAAARIYLARANSLQASGKTAEAGAAYQQVLAWNPPVDAEVRDTARLGLARVLVRQGNRDAALEQVNLVRTSAATPRLAERANALLADIEDDVPLNRLVGHVETGIAYDTNAPTLVSAVLDDDEDVPFPVDQRFDDFHARIAGRLEYRHQMDEGGSYLNLVAAGVRTFQFDLPELDRTRLELRAGPVFSLAGGSTDLLLGAKFDIEWRGERFRSSEPGAFIGLRQDLGPQLSGTAIYTLSWHDDFRDERDGLEHRVDGQLRYDAGDADVLRANLRVTREGADIERFRNWRLRGGIGWRHDWRTESRTMPFLELAADAERVFYDGLTTSGIERRDWKVRLNAEAGVEITRRWQASVNYGYYNISSNVPESDRLPNHQVGLNLRYSWN